MCTTGGGWRSRQQGGTGAKEHPIEVLAAGARHEGEWLTAEVLRSYPLPRVGAGPYLDGVVSRRLICVGVAVLFVVCVSPVRAAVLAQRGSDDDGTLEGYSYTAAAGERNVFSVTSVTSPLGAIGFADAGAPITVRASHAPCAQQSTNGVTCPGTRNLVVSLRDRNDTANVDLPNSYLNVEMTGGSGSDRLAIRSNSESLNSINGDAGDDQLSSGDGESSLSGGAGDDRLSGGAGFDSLDGGPGADDLKGGASNDTVSYALVKAPVSVTLDGRANDGTAGEHDWVHADIENVDIRLGTVVGNAKPNRLFVRSGLARGGGGPDALSGDRGATLYGGNGNDTINGSDQAVGYGGPGNDEMIGRMIAYGGTGKDQMVAYSGRFDGGADADTIKKGRRDEAAPVAATLIGGTGNDTMDGRDEVCEPMGVDDWSCDPAVARDRISCGPGHDSVNAGKRDIVARDCEHITRER